jgi:D-glycero-D-manno-heptose 1,7-bisphosphate phosphatase
LLDRDGVINVDREDYIKSPQEWTPITGSLEAIAQLYQHGYKLIVITNQSGVARGLFSEQTLHAIHTKMRQAVMAHGGQIDAIYFCPHQGSDQCECRKPKIGLLTQFAQDYAVDLTGVYFIGDSLRDIQAAQQAGAQPILVKTGNGLKTLQEHADILTTVLTFGTLYDAAQYIIRPTTQG